MKSNLESIPACLRVIARQIEKGEIEANTGLLTLRKKGAARPVVFGFGAKCEPVRECGRAALEVLRLSGVPPVSKEKADKALKAMDRALS
jgi:hypothetical protein